MIADTGRIYFRVHERYEAVFLVIFHTVPYDMPYKWYCDKPDYCCNNNDLSAYALGNGQNREKRQQQYCRPEIGLLY